MKHLSYLMPIALILSACHSGAIMEPNKNAPTNTKKEQVYWADSDYKAQKPVATVSQQNPNIIIEAPAQPVTNSVENDYYRTYPTVVQPAPANVKAAVVDENAQRIYSILTPRTVNKMLKETEDLYKSAAPKLFIAFPTVENQGFAVPSPEYAEILTEDIIVGAKGYDIVNSAEQADYTLKTNIIGANTSRGTAMVVYKVTLTDKQNKQIGSWVENANQVTNDDKSWW